MSSYFSNAVCSIARAALWSLATMSLAHAQSSSPLSLDEALSIATTRSPSLGAASHGIQASQEAAVAASQLPDPVLRLGVDNLPVNGPDSWSLTNDFMTQRRIGIAQEYVSSDKRALVRRRMELDAQRQTAAQRSLAAGIRRDVATAWLERYYATKSQDLLKALETEIELQVRTLDSQLRAGKALASDLPMATAVLLQNQDRMQVAKKQERVAGIALERWLGPDADRALASAPDIDMLATDLASSDVAAKAPTVREHASERDMAQADLEITLAAKKPNWSWEVSYSQRGSAYSNMVSVGVNIPLVTNAANKQDREIAAKQAQVLQAHAMHEDVFRETQAGIAANYAEWQSLIARRKSLAAALLPVVRQRVDLTMASYRGGQGSLSTVLEARRAEVETQLQLLDLEREAARLWAQLQYIYADGAQP
jgi:outer membrane protein TolC